MMKPRAFWARALARSFPASAYPVNDNDNGENAWQRATSAIRAAAKPAKAVKRGPRRYRSGRRVD